MKKKLFISFITLLSLITVNAQINKLSGYDEVGWPSGFYDEGTNGTFVLAKDGDAIKLVSQVAGVALNGKINHRFTPSNMGEYTLKFKAKKDGTAAQNITVNLLRTDAWTDLVSSQTNVSIDDVNYKEYTVTFTYREDIKTKTPQCFQLEIYVNGVLGNLWFKDIMLYENSNNQVAYVDGFETDLYWGMYQLNGNSWDRTPKTATEKGELIKINQSGNSVLQYTQQKNFIDPWSATVTRTWWAQRDVQYRINFDISSSITLPSSDAIGLEIWDGTNKILPATYFEVTPMMKSKSFITKKVTAESAYSATLFVGKLLAGEKIYIDNSLISPIHLYNATAEVVGNSINVSWLHSGYIVGDKLDITLIEGSNVTPIQSDVEIVEGTVSVNLTTTLDPLKEYKVQLKDNVGVGDYVVNNSTESSSFVYLPTGLNSYTENTAIVSISDGLLYISNLNVGSAIKIYSLAGGVVRSFTSTSPIETITIESGLYVVQINGKAFKVVL